MPPNFSSSWSSLMVSRPLGWGVGLYLASLPLQALPGLWWETAASPLAVAGLLLVVGATATFLIRNIDRPNLLDAAVIAFLWIMGLGGAFASAQTLWFLWRSETILNAAGG